MVIKECVNGAARNSPPKPSGQGSVQTDAARLHTSITRGLNLSQISIWSKYPKKARRWDGGKILSVPCGRIQDPSGEQGAILQAQRQDLLQPVTCHKALHQEIEGILPGNHRMVHLRGDHEEVRDDAVGRILHDKCQRHSKQAHQEDILLLEEACGPPEAERRASEQRLLHCRGMYVQIWIHEGPGIPDRKSVV